MNVLHHGHLQAGSQDRLPPSGIEHTGLGQHGHGQFLRGVIAAQSQFAGRFHETAHYCFWKSRIVKWERYWETWCNLRDDFIRETDNEQLQEASSHIQQTTLGVFWKRKWILWLKNTIIFISCNFRNWQQIIQTLNVFRDSTGFLTELCRLCEYFYELIAHANHVLLVFGNHLMAENQQVLHCVEVVRYLQREEWEILNLWKCPSNFW